MSVMPRLWRWLEAYWAEGILVLIGLVALGLTYRTPEPKAPRELTYAGKALSTWTMELALGSSEAAQAISNIGPKAVVGLLRIGQENNWADPGTVEALRILGPAAMPGILKALNDPSDTMRLSAIRALARLQRSARPADQILPSIRRSLLDMNPDIVFEGLCVLQEMGMAAQDALPELTLMLQRQSIDEDGTNDSIRQTSASLIGLFGPYARESVPALMSLLSDKLPCTRQRAAVALWRITHDTTMLWPELTRMINSEDTPTRRLGALALAQIRRDTPLDPTMAAQVDVVLASMSRKASDN